jgi:hypothetical protein
MLRKAFMLCYHLKHLRMKLNASKVQASQERQNSVIAAPKRTPIGSQQMQGFLFRHATAGQATQLSAQASCYCTTTWSLSE